MAQTALFNRQDGNAGAISTADPKKLSAFKLGTEARPFAQKDQDTLNASLFAAVSQNNLEHARNQLDAGAIINARDSNGRTALMDASFFGYREICRLLISKGIDIDAKDNAGRTALFWAKENCKNEIGELLKAAGARE
ncbi:MAG: ankyrin repeat domain-containing protein [Candidatus Micrarchaeota archaeon]|nr:ankyrin repeat domain-containing protein [Candidatus Micrarchaeota archaeon]